MNPIPDQYRKYIGWLIVVIAIIVAGFLGVEYPIPPPPPPSPIEAGVEGYQTNIHYDGPDKLVAESGGEIEMLSGSTLDVQSGATTSYGGTLDVDGAVTLNSTLDVDGNVTSGTGVFTITDGVNVGVDGTGYDVTFYSSTSGDLLLWDTSEEGLYITGTNAQDALDIVDGNVDIADDVDVDGTTNLDDVDIDLSAEFEIDGHLTDFGGCTAGTADADNDVCIQGDLEVDTGIYADGTLTVVGVTTIGGATTVNDNASITGTLDVDGAVTLNSTVDIDGNITSGTGVVTVTDAVNVGTNGTGYDVTFYSGTSDDLFLWDASEEGLYITGTSAQDALDIVTGNVDVADDVDIDGTTNLDDVDIDLSAALNIDGHMVDIGTGSYATADADNDLGVAGDLEVDGATDLDGTLAVAGAATLASDVTLSASTGNQGAVTEYIGVPKLSMVIGSAGTDGSITVDAIDTSPTGEWAEVDGGTNIVVTADTSIYRGTTNSVKIAFTAVVDNEGVDGTIAQTDFSAYESVGFWVYSDEAITSGDIDLTLDDTNGTDQVYNIGAVSASTWTYVELDISGCDANCDTTDGIHFLATAQGAGNLTDPDIYIDLMYVWDADDEEALGVSILNDGVIYVMVMVTATGGNRIPLPAVEYTSWVTHYESGNDFIVYLDNQSANSVWALVATE